MADFPLSCPHTSHKTHNDPWFMKYVFLFLIPGEGTFWGKFWWMILWFIGFDKICSDKDLEISCQNKNFSDRKFYPSYRAPWQARLEYVQMQSELIIFLKIVPTSSSSPPSSSSPSKLFPPRPLTRETNDWDRKGNTERRNDKRKKKHLSHRGFFCCQLYCHWPSGKVPNENPKN